MTERKLASIRRIDNITPIDGADKIVRATVGGWNVVTAIDNGFKVGDLVVYLEVDSWVPSGIAPFLTKPGHFPKTYNGVEGEKLKSIKLRGVVSQGLIMPMHVLTNYGADLEEGADVTETLGIQKWEKEIPAQLAGTMKGNFPSFIPKTDQERVQNIRKALEAAIESGLQFEITEKLEGSSMTCYLHQGEFGVCSRNIDLKRDESNSFWMVAIRDRIEEKLRAYGKDIAVQGELVGPGIQDNIYKMSTPEFFIFDIYDIAKGEYLSPPERRELCDNVLGFHHSQVPVVAHSAKLKDTLGITTMEQIIDFADGKSTFNPNQDREGLVYKQVGGGMTFKTISNRYLIKQKD